MNYKLCLFLASPLAPATGVPSALPTALTHPLPSSIYPNALSVADGGLSREGIAADVTPTQERSYAGH